MRNRRHIITLIFLFLLPIYLHAQDDTIDYQGLDIEQRCAGESSEPPDDWTFDGAILLRGHFGIHAVSADIDTPYVVAFIDSRDVFSSIALSPDNKWAVVSVGRYRNTTTENNFYAQGEINTSGLRVYSTGQIRETYFVSFEFRDGYSGGTHPTPIAQPVWIDNETIAFNRSVLNPFSGEIFEEGNRFYDIVKGSEWGNYPSPDWSRQIYVDGGWQHYGADATVYDPTFDEINSLYVNIGTITALGAKDVIWKPDSSQFVVHIPAPDRWDNKFRLPEYLALYDKDGQFIEVVLNLQNHEIYWVDDTKSWSSDGRNLAFFVGKTEGSPASTLHIANMQSKVIIDTCLTVDDSVAWSPDGTQIALIGAGDDQRPVYVFDMDTWELYTVAYHDGSVIAWRED